METEATTGAVTVIEHDMVNWTHCVEASWDRARCLAQDITKGAKAIVELGQVLAALKEQWFEQGIGGGGNTRLALQDRGVPKCEKGRLVVSNMEMRGWQRRVEEELDISYKTADRYIEKAQYTCMMRDLIAGEAIQYVDSKKNVKVVEPTPELQELAASKVREVILGTVNAKRAWAGLIGEGTRRGRQDGDAKRAPVDHRANLLAAMTKLNTSLPFYDDMDVEDRAAIEKVWRTLVKALPSAWKKVLKNGEDMD